MEVLTLLCLHFQPLETSLELFQLSILPFSLERPQLQLPHKKDTLTNQQSAATTAAVMKCAVLAAALHADASALIVAVVDRICCKLHDQLRDHKNWFLTLKRDDQNRAVAATVGYNLVLKLLLAPPNRAKLCKFYGNF